MKTQIAYPTCGCNLQRPSGRPTLRRPLLVYAAALMLTQFVRGAVMEAWIQDCSGSLTNRIGQAKAIAVDASGNVIVAGSSNTDLYAATDGALIWAGRYRKSEYESASVRALAIDNKGNAIVVGTLCAENCAGLLVKYAADGTLLWERNYDGFADDYPEAVPVVVDANGNIIVAAEVQVGTNLLWRTAKYAMDNGNLLWEQRFSEAPDKNGVPNGLSVDREGDIIVTGVFWHAAPQSDTNRDYTTIKYSGTNGSLVWEQHYVRATFSWGDYRGPALAVDRSGNVAVAETAYIAKYAVADGALIWENRYDSPQNEAPMAVDSDGNVIIPYRSTNTDYDYYLAKYAAGNGQVMWEKAHPNYNDLLGAVTVDAAGGVVVTGSRWIASGYDYYMAKYAAGDGTLVWETDFVVPESVGASALALGSSGTVAISGTLYSSSAYSNSNPCFVTLLYREVLAPISIEKAVAGVRLCFNGLPGVSNDLQRVVAVTGPWETIASVITLPDGSADYLDTVTTSGSTSYRLAVSAAR